ncbi:MAG: type III-A CRISPR-associated protein Csm2 [Anaerolineae bacterium]|nr:type III-A CRISPR-associated protein Csm2 [Anaerolineae bacterium]
MSDRRSREPRFRGPSQEELETIITDPNGAELMVKWAEDIGRALARQLATNQIRSLFGEVRNIEGDWKVNPQRAGRNLILLKPKMAYRARRERGDAVRDLVSVLEPSIDQVNGKEENFQRFVEFFEAILAYHKAHGGN